MTVAAGQISLKIENKYSQALTFNKKHLFAETYKSYTPILMSIFLIQ